MARIRSIHPGLFTDEAFASLSMAARVLLLGVWTECDDQGVFEWKPVTLKMRIFSADNLDVVPLLAELERSDSVRQFRFEGKPHGAVRNFCKYQKPKTPKFRAVTDDEIRNYVASKYPKGESSASQQGQFPQNGEMTSQREEGGDSLEDGNGLGGGGKRPAPAKNSKPVSRSEGGTKLTLDFEAGPATRETIRAMGFGDAQFNNEFSKFVQYYMARGTRFDDWNAGLVAWFQRAKPEPVSQPVGLAVVNKVLVIEGTLEERCWQQDTRERTGRGMPIIDIKGADGRSCRGWYRPTKFPPGYDEATGEKLSTKAEDAA